MCRAPSWVTGLTIGQSNLTYEGVIAEQIFTLFFEGQLNEKVDRGYSNSESKNKARQLVQVLLISKQLE